MTQPHRCPVCSTASEISFLFDVRAASYMVLDSELIGLNDIAARLHCPTCNWGQTGVLHDAVVDLDSLKISAGQFIPNR